MQLTYTGAEYSNQDLFEEVKETALREAVSSIAQYKDLIDELVEEKRIYGFFSDDEDLAQVKEDLARRWPEIEKTLLNKAGKPLY